jgi:hypothetical protein
MKAGLPQSRNLFCRQENARCTKRATLELERLRECLLYEHTRVVSDAKVQTWLKRAAEEAASIAWATPYPFLVLPILLDEKLSDARRKAEVQKSIYVRPLWL